MMLFEKALKKVYDEHFEKCKKETDWHYRQ